MLPNTIDRLDARRDIGAAAKRITAAEQAYFAARKEERDRLHARWRQLQSEADQARNACERVTAGHRSAADPADIAIIRKAKRDHPDLLVYSEAPGQRPRLCAATGLALFEGDDVYGDSEYGGAILKAAVDLKVDPVGPIGRV